MRRVKAAGLGDFAVLNADGQPLYSWIGYGQPDGWIETLSSALEDPISVAAREDRYRSEPSFQDALILGKLSHREGQYGEAESYYIQARALDAQAAREADIPILMFRSISRGVGVEQFTVPQLAAYLEKLFGSDEMKPEYALEVAESLVQLREQVGEEVIIPYLKTAYPFLSDISDPALEDRRKRALVGYTLIVEKDPEKALRLKRETLPQGWESDSGHLNEFAWWCFENQVNLKEAEDLSRRSVDLLEPGEEQASCLDTLAELVNLRGAPGEAVDLIEKALKMNPESEYLQSQLKKFKEMTALGAS